MEEGQGEASVSLLMDSSILDLPAEATNTNLEETSMQTEERWSSPLDFLALTVEITSLKTELETLQQTVNTLLLENEKLKSELLEKNSVLSFGVGKVLQLQKKTKRLFVFYTAITYIRFCSLLSFLISSESVQYEKGRADLTLSFPGSRGWILRIQEDQQINVSKLFNGQHTTINEISNETLDISF